MSFWRGAKQRRRGGSPGTARMACLQIPRQVHVAGPQERPAPTPNGNMTQFDPKIHHRRSIRLPGYDYSHAGAYYVTIVSHGRECLFGQVAGGEMKLSQFGKIVQYTWLDLPKHYPHVELDAFCIMPNHVHAMIILNDDGGHALSEIVRALKTFSARRINALRNTVGVPVWQRNYYEHIIRDNQEYLAKCGYIQNNPLNWDQDAECIP